MIAQAVAQTNDGENAAYQEKLTSMQRLITEMMDAKGINAWARLNFEYGETAVYMVMKHRDSTRLDELNAIADEIETEHVRIMFLPGLNQFFFFLNRRHLNDNRL